MSDMAEVEAAPVSDVAEEAEAAGRERAEALRHWRSFPLCVPRSLLPLVYPLGTEERG